MDDEILDVDLLGFEQGERTTRQAVIDGVRRSLRTGFVYTSHDLAEDLLDQAYAMLAEFFSRPAEDKARFVAPGSHGQTGYTGLLVETAASSDVPDWKEMLNWGREAPAGHPLRTRFPHRYGPQVLPEAAVPGISEVLNLFHDRIADLQRRFLRIIAAAIGCHDDFFEGMLRHGPTSPEPSTTPPWSWRPARGTCGRASTVTSTSSPRCPEPRAPGLQVKTDGGWIDAVAPPGGVIINTGMMLEQLSNGAIPTGIHRVVSTPGQSGDRYSVVQFCHPTPWTVLAPVPSCVSPEHPQRYGAIPAGDRLDEVLWEINLVEDGRRLG